MVKILILNLRGDLNVDYFELQLLGNPVSQLYLGFNQIN